MKDSPQEQSRLDPVFLELLKGLNASVSIANRYWVAALSASISSLLAVFGFDGSVDGAMALPFGLGRAPYFFFYLTAFFTLGVILIGFAAATAHLSQSRKILEKYFLKLKGQTIHGSGCTYDEAKDLLIASSVFRVFPLIKDHPRKRILYLAYKIVSWLVSYLFPMVCLGSLGFRLIPFFENACWLYSVVAVLFLLMSGFAIWRAFREDANFSKGVRSSRLTS